MFFTINRNLVFNNDITKFTIMSTVRSKILIYKNSVNEKKLDKYLLNKYNINLKLACLILLSNCTISNLENNTYIVTFLDKKYDKLASIITYGNELVRGSNILKFAFERY